MMSLSDMSICSANNLHSWRSTQNLSLLCSWSLTLSYKMGIFQSTEMHADIKTCQRGDRDKRCEYMKIESKSQEWAPCPVWAYHLEHLCRDKIL